MTPPAPNSTARTARTLCLLAILSVPLVSAAQPQASLPQPATLTYDVVSIKPNKSGSGDSHWSTGKDSFIATNISLGMMLASAYGIRDGLISGVPAWAETAHFDINAKIVDHDPDAIARLTPPQRQAMIARLLTDRFHLKVHTETKTIPVYDLVLTRDGPRFKQSAPPPAPADPTKPDARLAPGSFTLNEGEFRGSTISVASFIDLLSSQLNRTVVDKTGLTGRYDLHLKWTPDEAPTPLNNGQAAADVAPPLFNALQEQLGLKLQPSHGPVETLVVDRVDFPSEN